MNTTRLASARKAPPERDLTPAPTFRGHPSDCLTLGPPHPTALTFIFSERKFRVAAIIQVSGKRISTPVAPGQRVTIPIVWPARRTGVSADRSSCVGAMPGMRRRGDADAAGKWI